METQTVTNEINQTLEDIYEFIKSDKKVFEDFTEYTKTLGIYGTPDNKMKEYYSLKIQPHYLENSTFIFKRWKPLIKV